MRPRGTIVRLAALFAVGIALRACGDRVIDNPTTDTYSGQSIISSVQGYYHYPEGPDTDLVTFSVTGTSYTLTFQTHNCGLCDMSGAVKQFGTNAMRLTTELFLTSNCDNKRVPTGEMTTMFRGDSLIVGPVTVGYVLTANNVTLYDTSVFEFRLKAE